MMRFIKGPRTKTKMLVINHSLKEDQFINPKSYNWDKTEKRHQCTLYFQHVYSALFLKHLIDWLVSVLEQNQGQLNSDLTS